MKPTEDTFTYFYYLGVSKTPEENLSNPSYTRKSDGFIGKGACLIMD